MGLQKCIFHVFLCKLSHSLISQVTPGNTGKCHHGPGCCRDAVNEQNCFNIQLQCIIFLFSPLLLSSHLSPHPLLSFPLILLSSSRITIQMNKKWNLFMLNMMIHDIFVVTPSFCPSLNVLDVNHNLVLSFLVRKYTQ